MSDNEDIWTGGFRKNAKDEVRVSLSIYRGVPLLGLRVWFKADDGTQRPGKDGFSVKVDQLPLLKALLVEAESHALKRGLLAADTHPATSHDASAEGLSSLIQDLTEAERKGA